MLRFDRLPTVFSYVIAGLVAIVVPMCLGYVIFRANPSACYDSPCLLPLLLVIASPFAGPVLAVLFLINHRMQKRVPDGWIPTIVFSGLTAQIAVSMLAVATSSPGFRGIFLSELVSIPQGFLFGVTVGSIFWIALNASARRRDKSPS
ncbi:hypothetical protein [Marivita sp.]|uniref:hypothetical protein n=1 Tax=Marivita sp. TaxID=2003365 RepID=UPI003F6BE850